MYIPELPPVTIITLPVRSGSIVGLNLGILWKCGLMGYLNKGKADVMDHGRWTMVNRVCFYTLRSAPP